MRRRPVSAEPGRGGAADYREAAGQFELCRVEILPAVEENPELTGSDYARGECDLLRALTARRSYFRGSLSLVNSQVALRQADVLLSDGLAAPPDTEATNLLDAGSATKRSPASDDTGGRDRCCLTGPAAVESGDRPMARPGATLSMFRCVSILLTIGGVLSCPFTCTGGMAEFMPRISVAADFSCSDCHAPCEGGPAPGDGCDLDCVCKVLVEGPAKVPALALLWSPVDGLCAVSAADVVASLCRSSADERSPTRPGLEGGFAIRIAHASLLI